MNPLYLIINEADEYIKEKKGGKYLIQWMKTMKYQKYIYSGWDEKLDWDHK